MRSEISLTVLGAGISGLSAIITYILLFLFVYRNISLPVRFGGVSLLDRSHSLFNSILIENYNRNELLNLCFEIGMAPENVKQLSSSEMIMEIGYYCNHHGYYPKLAAAILREKPNLNESDKVLLKRIEDPDTVLEKGTVDKVFSYGVFYLPVVVAILIFLIWVLFVIPYLTQ